MSSNWSDFERKVACSLLTHSRNRLKLQLETCITSAFLMIDKYYKVNKKSPYNFFIVIVTSLFSSCKNHESAHTMQQIFSELLHCCREGANTIGAAKLMGCLGIKSFDDRPVSTSEINDINQCELDLLEANGFDLLIESPFKYIDYKVMPVIEQMPPDQFKVIKQNLVKNVFIYFSSQSAAEYPNIVIAVLSTEAAFRNVCEMPIEIKNWIIEIENSNVGEILQHAREQRAKEAAAIAQRRQNRQ